MARTLAEIDAAVAALESWRIGTAAPALTTATAAVRDIRGDVTALQEADATITAAVGGLRERLRSAFRALMSGRVEGMDGESGSLQPALTAAEMRVLRWLLAERSRISR